MALLCRRESLPDYIDCNNETTWPPLEPDPDIAGIGVLLSFTISCGLTVLLLSVVEWQQDRYGIRRMCREWQDTKPSKKPWLIKSVKTFFLPDIPCVLSDKAIPATGIDFAVATLEKDAIAGKIFWFGVFNLTLSYLADTQFITGLAIGAALNLKCSISVYHYEEAALMVILASVGSSIAMKQLAQCRLTLAKLGIRHNSFLSPLTRVTLLWAFLIIFLGFHMQNLGAFNSPLNFPARCLEDHTGSQLIGFPLYWTNFTTWIDLYFLLRLSYFNLETSLAIFVPRLATKARAFRYNVFHSLSSIIFTYPKALFLYSPSSQNTLGMQKEAKILRKVGNVIAHVIKLLAVGLVWIPLLAIRVIESPIPRAVMFLIAFIFLNILLWAVRSSAHWQYFTAKERAQENAWGFGQIVPMIVMSWVVLAMFDAIASMYSSSTFLI